MKLIFNNNIVNFKNDWIIYVWIDIFVEAQNICVLWQISCCSSIRTKNAMNAYHACLVLRKKKGSNQNRVHLLILRIACF